MMFVKFVDIRFGLFAAPFRMIRLAESLVLVSRYLRAVIGMKVALSRC